MAVRSRALKTRINISQGDIEEAAESLKLRLMARRGKWNVFVCPDGEVVIENTANPSAKPMPFAWQIGTYTREVPTEVIEDDLTSRFHEIHRRAA